MKKRTREAWRELIQSWKAGDLTQKQFCAQHSIAYSAFHYWFKKFREERTDAESGPGFAPVTIASDNRVGNHGSVLAEVVLTDGRRVRLYQGIDVQFLRDLLS
jgi:transposase-like protein